MTNTAIKNKIILCSSLLLLLMFIHVTGIIAQCESQVTNNTVAISAFNG